MFRLYNNMFGTKSFHPLALKSLISDSTKIKEYLDSRTSALPLSVKERAANFIRYKETKSTFEIEGEASKSRYYHIPFDRKSLTFSFLFLLSFSVGLFFSTWFSLE
jgi:hypothetical protein